MNEIGVRFGSANHLVGTVSIPAQTMPAQTGELGIVFPSAGLLHRIGPHRLHVRLARAAAELGYPSIRFDMPGIGDSGSPGGRDPYEAQALRASRDAMDFLHRETGASRFMVAGLCAGADSGFAVALQDPRIHALFLMEPPMLASDAASRMLRMLRKLREYGPRMAVVRLMQVFAALRGGEGEAADAGLRSVPPPQEYVAALERLDVRGVHLRLVYADCSMGAYDLRQHRARCFSRLQPSPRFRVDVISGSDHLFTQSMATAALERSFIDALENVAASGSGRVAEQAARHPEVDPVRAAVRSSPIPAKTVSRSAAGQ